MGAGDHYAGAAPAGHDPVSLPSAPPGARPPGAILYDGATRDFLVNDGGDYRVVHPVDQKVALALVVGEGDIAGRPTVGSRLRALKRGPPSKMPGAVENEVRRALADMLRDGEIEILSIDTKIPSTGKLLVTVRYKNLLVISSKSERVVPLTV